jgi:hypothetical protein
MFDEKISELRHDLLSELDESVAAAERYGWVSEEKANEYIDGLLVHGKTTEFETI